MENNDNPVPFSPILIMEFIRQTTVAHALTQENPELVTKFHLNKDCYQKILNFPLKAQMIRLYSDYDESAELLNVHTDETLINRFKEQKSLVEIAQKYEGQFSERYKSYIQIVN